MPRLSKREKREWDFFINPATGRRTYNGLCRKCTGNCKQSFQTKVIICDFYQSKRSEAGKRRLCGTISAPEPLPYKNIPPLGESRHRR